MDTLSREVIQGGPDRLHETGTSKGIGMKASDQESGELGRQIGPFHGGRPGPMPGEPAPAIQVLLVAGLQGGISKEAPHSRRHSEDVGTGRRHASEMAFGSQESRSRFGGLERRSSLHATAETNDPDSASRFAQDVAGVDSAVDDVALVGMDQAFGCLAGGFEDGGRMGILHLAQVGTIDEASHHGELGGSQPVSPPVNPKARADGWARQVREDLVLAKDPLERTIVRIATGMLEHHEVTSSGMSGQVDPPFGITSETREDPESMLDVAGAKIRGFS